MRMTADQRRSNLHVVSLTLLLLIAGCHKKQPVSSVASPTTPPTSTAPATPAYILTLESATREFNTGDFTAAARDYNRYLQQIETGGARDQALYHLGIIYALPTPGVQDWNRALGFFKQLSTEFPASPYKGMAQLIVSLKDQATQMADENRKMTSEVAQLQARIDGLQTSSSQLTAQITTLKNTADQLQQDIQQKDQKIRQLTSDLERIIRIDTQSRPRP